MPTFKLAGAKAKEQKSGFEPYDGPVPNRKGLYRGVIKVMKHGLNAGSGSQGFAITLELEAAEGDPKDHAIYDGYPMFSRSIITESKEGGALKEGAQRNLDNLLAALGTGDEPSVVLDKGDDDKVNVLKIGGINPIGRVVNVEVGFRIYEGEREPEVSGIWPYKETDAPTGKGRAQALVVEDDDAEEDDESDLIEGDDEAEEGSEYDDRKVELEAMSVAALRKLAKEDYDLQSSGAKSAVVERILDHEFSDEDEAEEAEDDEAEEADEVDEAEEDEAEDDEEEDDEDDEEREARVAELADLARPALKSILKEIAPDFTVLKRHSDDDLRTQIIGVEFADDLPF